MKLVAKDVGGMVAKEADHVPKESRQLQKTGRRYTITVNVTILEVYKCERIIIGASKS